MQINTRFKGYTKELTSLETPLNTLSMKKKIINQEKQTLFGECLRFFIKQRLYGNFISKDSLVKHKRSINTDRTYDSSSRQQSNINKNYKSSRSNSKQSYHLRKSQKQEKLKQISKSLSFKKEIKPIYCGSMINRYQKKIAKQNQEQSQQSEGFLSAIEKHEGFSKQMLQLPKLKNIVPLKSSIMKKQTVIKIQINQHFWYIFCNNMLPEVQSPTMITSEIKLRKNSFNLQLLQNIQSSDKKNILLPQKQKKKLSFNELLQKQGWSHHINNKETSIPQLLVYFNQYFDLSNRLYDNMKISIFEKIMLEIVQQQDRIWGFFCFQFWDYDHNGIIDSTDLFKIYQYLDKLLETCEKKYQNSNIINKLLEFGGILPTQSKINNKAISMIKKKKQNSKTINKNDIIYMNIKNIGKMQEQINYYNQLIISNNNTNVQLQKKSKYLEQVLIKKKKKIKYNDLWVILGQKSEKKSINKQVIDIDLNVLNMKFVSCYRQCFQATDHNEQTRANRDYLQILKQQLQKQNIQSKCSANENGFNTLLGITYTQYIDAKLYKNTKNILLNSIGVTIIRN